MARQACTNSRSRSDLVDPAAEIARDGAHRNADQGRHRRGEQADQQGGARAVHDHGQDIAAERIGAEREGGVLAGP
jgi:hypothetical protein